MAITNMALSPIQINTLSLTQIIQWWNWSRIKLCLIARIEMTGAVVTCLFSKTENSRLTLVELHRGGGCIVLVFTQLSTSNCQLCILSSLQALLPQFNVLPFYATLFTFSSSSVHMQDASWSFASSCASPCLASSSSRTTCLRLAYRECRAYTVQHAKKAPFPMILAHRTATQTR